MSFFLKRVSIGPLFNELSCDAFELFAEGFVCSGEFLVLAYEGLLARDQLLELDALGDSRGWSILVEAVLTIRVLPAVGAWHLHPSAMILRVALILWQVDHLMQVGRVDRWPVDLVRVDRCSQRAIVPRAVDHPVARHREPIVGVELLIGLSCSVF